MTSVLTINDFNVEVIEALEDFFAIKRLNGANEDAEFDIKLYNAVDDGDLDNQRIGRFYNYDTGAHTYSFDYYVGYGPGGYLGNEKSTIYYDVDGQDVYQLNGDNGDVLYTADLNEIKVVLETLDYDFAGFAFKVGVGEVDRLFNSETGQHLITGDDNEVATLVAEGWSYEGTV